jgi:probable phosphoglycerate mutase
MKVVTGRDCAALLPFSVEKGIPTEAECRDLWLRFGVPDEVTVHSRKVAELARILAVYLRRAGLKLDVDLITAGGYLHDIVNGRLEHAGAGERILRQLGYARVCEVLAPDAGPLGSDGTPNEADLIFLAEQSLEEYGPGSFNGTFKPALNLHECTADELREMVSRQNRAAIIREGVEKLVGLSLKSIIRKHGRGILAVSVQGIRNVYLLMHGAVGLRTDNARLAAQELPLCTEGIGQSWALREELKDVPLSGIYCSDLKPAVESARIIAEPHGLKPVIRGGLREIGTGDWSGPLSSEALDLYSSQYGHDMLNFRPAGGETLFECSGRVIPAFYDILNTTFGNMAIVGHPVVNRIILCQVLGLSLERLFELDQSCGRASRIYCNGADMRLMSMNGDDRRCRLLN